MKPQNIRNALPIILILLSCRVGQLYAQNDPGKWNINLVEGIPFTSFNEGSLIIPVTGLDVNYKINPLISLQTNFYKGIFKNKHETNFYGRTFHNSYWSAAIRPELNFLRILNAGKITNTIGLLGFAGIGVLKNNVTTSINNKILGWEYFKGVNNRNASLFYSFGTAIKINLTPRISFLMRYEYNLSNSDYIDGFTTVNNVNLIHVGKNNFTNDNYSFVTTGISINLGKQRKTDIERKVDDLDRFYQFDSDKIIALEKKVNQNAKLLRDHNNTLGKIEYENKIDTLVSKRELKKLFNEVSRIQFQFDSLSAHLKPFTKSKPFVEKEANVERSVIEYYIIADSFLEIDKANELVDELKVAGYTHARLITDKYNIWYLVTYDQTTNKDQAQKLLRRIRNNYNPLAWLLVKKL